jgi:hypothetical protein
VVRDIPVLGGGSLFVKSHADSPWIWVDHTPNPDEKIQRSVCVVAKADPTQTARCWEVADYGRAVHFEYNREGTQIWVSVWGRADAPGKTGEMDGYWIKTVIRDQGSGIRDQSAEDEDEKEAVATLRVVGEKLAEDQPLELDAGWNLVSYLPRQPLAVTQALQSIAGQYFAVLGYDQGALSYYADLDPSFNTLRTMEPLHGYWIKMNQAGTLQYPVSSQRSAYGRRRSS